MLEPQAALISCSSWQEIFTTLNKIRVELNPDVQRQLAAVVKSYAAAYGFEGVYGRLNGRTVAQVLSEYREPALPAVVSSGERDGVTYTLYEAPSHEGQRAEPGNAADRPRE
jgi:hypothetical protein